MRAKLKNGSFKEKVLRAVSKIPRGKVLTYKKVAEFARLADATAKRAGHPRARRAVGNILNKNHNPKIPCRRVIRLDGKVGKYNREMWKKLTTLKEERLRRRKT